MEACSFYWQVIVSRILVIYGRLKYFVGELHLSRKVILHTQLQTDTTEKPTSLYAIASRVDSL